MRIEYQIESNNITYKKGDTLIIDFSNSFEYVKSINYIDFDFSPLETAEKGHEIYIRWSYDIKDLDRQIGIGRPHVNWSAWEKITQNGSPISSVYSKINRTETDSFDLQFKLIRRDSDGARRINLIVIDWIEGNIPEEVSEPYVKNTSCKANSCPSTDFSSGVVINCDSNLFRPYNVINPAIKLYKEISCAVSDMFGHCVRYFKTQAKLDSADPILKEYSLYEVTDVKDINILIPDNQFPDNAIRFLPYDMDFGDGLEVHIVKEHFQRAFGFDDLPEQKDYIYFPLIDRIYEVNSAYLFRDFMAAESYYKVMLFKWQDKVNVMRNNPEIDEYVNDLHESLDEVLGDEIKKQYEQVTKPQQYQTIAVGGYDYVRSHINESLIIQNEDISNYFTIIGKYFYDMTKKMNWNDIAVKYKAKVDRKISENTAFSMWFKNKHKITDTNPYNTLIDGYNYTDNKGFLINLNYDSVTKNTKSIDLRYNNRTVTFDSNFPQLNTEDWYAIVVNHINEFKQACVHIWKMQYNQNLPSTGQPKTTNLQLIYTEVKDIVAEAINPNDTFYKLRAGTDYITNVRVWNENMDEEKQPITLNQYVVKDSHLAILIDNAVSTLRLVKEFVR